MRKGNSKGFTLIEVIVVAAIIAILAGILVPMIMNQIDEAKVTRAKAECDTYAKTLTTFRANTSNLFWPNRLSAMPDPASLNLLFSDGNVADNAVLQALGYSTDKIDFLKSQLATNPGWYIGPDGKDKWKSLISDAPADPWGNAYMINVLDLEDKNTVVWVLSAGPNGKFETPKGSTDLVGDDIGVKVVH